MSSRPRLDLFLNIGHALDHLVMLIFPTAVLAIGEAWQMSYGQLLPLALGGFIAFGAFSLPAGWLADHWSRTGMMRVFFFGIGAATLLTGFARTPAELAAGLAAIGMFAAIYHPVGIAMLVANRSDIGRTLGVNGVFGNTGLAFAALFSGALADLAGWRAAFILPGLLCIGIGLGFVVASRGVESPAAREEGRGGCRARCSRAYS
jgi:MFS family permease